MRTIPAVLICLSLCLAGCSREKGPVQTAQRRHDGSKTLTYWNQANDHLKEYREKHALFMVSAALVKETDEELREKLGLLKRVISAHMEGLNAAGVDSELLDFNRRLVTVLKENPETKESDAKLEAIAKEAKELRQELSARYGITFRSHQFESVEEKKAE